MKKITYILMLSIIGLTFSVEVLGQSKKDVRAKIDSLICEVESILKIFDTKGIQENIEIDNTEFNNKIKEFNTTFESFRNKKFLFRPNKFIRKCNLIQSQGNDIKNYLTHLEALAVEVNILKCNIDRIDTIIYSTPQSIQTNNLNTTIKTVAAPINSDLLEQFKKVHSQFTLQGLKSFSSSYNKSLQSKTQYEIGHDSISRKQNEHIQEYLNKLSTINYRQYRRLIDVQNNLYYFHKDFITQSNNIIDCMETIQKRDILQNKIFDFIKLCREFRQNLVELGSTKKKKQK